MSVRTSANNKIMSLYFVQIMYNVHVELCKSFSNLTFIFAIPKSTIFQEISDNGVQLRSVRDSQPLYTFRSNSDNRQKLLSKSLPERSDIQVPIKDNFYAQVKLLLPPDMLPWTKYPMVVMVGGQPGRQIEHR